MRPEETLAQMRRAQRRWMITGVLVMAAAPLLWVGTAVLGMFAVHETIATSANPTPDELGVGIRISMVAPVVGAVVAFAGLALVLWSMQRKRWLDEVERELASGA
jgi:protein-S-isoprenylcysteine O-methyltransferase Ste14